MEFPPELKPGLKGHTEFVVREEHTAPHVGSGRIAVFATPMLVNLLEAAALDAAERFLPPGHQSLGTRLDMHHIAATPIGMRVRAEAELVGVEGRVLRFQVVAYDEREKIGDGYHERVVVNVARFDKRAQEKAAAARGQSDSNS